MDQQYPGFVLVAPELVDDVALVDLHRAGRVLGLYRLEEPLGYRGPGVTIPAGHDLQRPEPLEVEVHVPEQRVDHGQALEIVTHVQLLGHAHPAVQLDGVLADEPAGLAHLNLES